MTATDDALTQLEQLLQQYSQLESNARYEDLSDLREGRVFANRLQATLERITPPGSSYASRVQRFGKNPDAFTRDLVHIAAALREDIQSGWFASVIELAHADTHSDYLEMAGELAEKDYKDAAAVIAGSSLEVHLRALCAKHGIDSSLAGRVKKADTINADLTKAGVYGSLEQKQITAWLGLRNAAAHGEYDKYGTEHVKLFISGVRGFILKYPG